MTNTAKSSIGGMILVSWDSFLLIVH